MLELGVKRLLHKQLPDARKELGIGYYDESALISTIYCLQRY